MQPIAGTGRLVGRYAIYDAIASGGMATVHIGKLLGPVGFSRIVAIKRLHENLARDATFVAMMIDEARLASRIDHPCVVPMLDVVSTEQELFIVMEYVNGRSLSTLLELAKRSGEPVPAGIAVSIVVDALHGLHAAHEAKGAHGESLEIVHRDVSPHNILVGVDGTARVADFGIAKAAGRLQATLTGQVKGKVAYMAPEQLLSEPVDRRADVYAAGIVLWEALTGRHLFRRDSEAATITAVLMGTREPPSTHAPGLPKELDSIVMRALEKDPAARFATAHDLAIALEDAVPLPRAHVIGAWMTPIVAGELDALSTRIAAIDAASSIMTLEVAQAPPPTADEPRADVPSAPARARSVRGPLIGAAIALACAASIAYVASRPRAQEPPASPPLAASLEAPAAVPAPAVTSSSPPVTAPASSPAPAPAPSPSAERPRQPHPGPVAPPSRPSSTASAPTRSCDPPYTFDRSGIKVPKRECL